MPNPAVASSLCSGSISPKSKPLERPGIGGDMGSSDGIAGDNCVKDLDAWLFGEPGFRGLLTLLAKD